MEDRLDKIEDRLYNIEDKLRIIMTLLNVKKPKDDINP